jgi:hypothetical protein
MPSSSSSPSVGFFWAVTKAAVQNFPYQRRLFEQSSSEGGGGGGFWVDLSGGRCAQMYGISSEAAVGSTTLGRCEKLPCFIGFFASPGLSDFCQNRICQKPVKIRSASWAARAALLSNTSRRSATSPSTLQLSRCRQATIASLAPFGSSLLRSSRLPAGL